MEMQRPMSEIFHPTLCNKQIKLTNNPCKSSCSSKCQCITRHLFPIMQIKFLTLSKTVGQESTLLFHNSISNSRRKCTCRMARLSDNKIHHKSLMLVFWIITNSLKVTKVREILLYKEVKDRWYKAKARDRIKLDKVHRNCKKNKWKTLLICRLLKDLKACKLRKI